MFPEHNLDFDSKFEPFTLNRYIFVILINKKLLFLLQSARTEVFLFQYSEIMENSKL